MYHTGRCGTCKYTELYRLPHCLVVASTYDVQLESHYSVVITSVTCVTVSGTIVFYQRQVHRLSTSIPYNVKLRK